MEGYSKEGLSMLAEIDELEDEDHDAETKLDKDHAAREKLRAYNRAYYKRNRAKRLAERRTYYQANKEKEAERQKDYKARLDENGVLPEEKRKRAQPRHINPRDERLEFYRRNRAKLIAKALTYYYKRRRKSVLDIV